MMQPIVAFHSHFGVAAAEEVAQALALVEEVESHLVSEALQSRRAHALFQGRFLRLRF